MKIGIAGTGRMGAALAQRLAGLGHEVRVWNRTKEKARALQSVGAKAVETPAQLAQESGTVISILTDAAAIDAVYKDLLSGDVSGKLFIEMSTVRPETEKQLSERVKRKGAGFVECPVGGTTGPALNGKLIGFAGGEPADVSRAKPVLEQLCRRLEHVGPAGAGSSMKLAINLPLMVYWQALGEALSLIEPLGLDPARVMDILADTSGGPNFLKMRAPLIAAALGGKQGGAVTFDVDSMRKDARTMIAEAKSLGRALPAVEAALAGFDRASRDGLGAADCVAVPVHWLRKAKA